MSNLIPRWQFRKMNPGEVNIDPIEGEFFTTEALGSITDALVRESIQNSLDASDGDNPVKVRFSLLTLSKKQLDSHSIIDTYLPRLSPHLDASHSGLPNRPSFSDDLDYLLIEDYGTGGLQGDVRQYDDLDNHFSKNDFFYFWRNIGRNRKEGTDLGRWGLGKTVFQAASRINSFWGLTVRKDDGQPLLMGQSVLKIHKVDNHRYAPYGYFGLFDHDLALPVNNAQFTKRFADTFSIDRSGKPGLSILLPYPEGDISPNDCLRSAIQHYFYPILAGKLIFEMRHHKKSLTIDARSLNSFLKKSSWPEKQGLLGLLDLSKWAIDRKRKQFTHLKLPTPGKAPKLRENLLDHEQLDSLRHRFNNHERLAFYVPVTVQKSQSKERVTTGFSVFLERDENLDRAEDHFIRQGITIPEVTSLKHKGVRALVSITDLALSSFLGDSENPAHTEWERNSKKFKQKYKLGVSTLDFVKSSPRELVKLLTQPKKGRDENLLNHISPYRLRTHNNRLPEKAIRRETAHR